MTRNIYALLVGIDEYKPPVPPLKGCVNDIMAIKGYLEQRVNSEGYQLNLRTLLNQDATRQAIIDGFEQHLTQATSEDVAFFYYAGHGAQENAPKEFLAFEPDGMDETIVCYDSRRNGAWDLADKELAKLIAKVAEKNPHITIIMDCCHSGSGSRDVSVETATRMAPKDERQRPLDSYIFSPQDAGIIAPASTRSLDVNSGGFAVTTGKHIFLSACLNNQLAKEYNGDGQPRGAFSFFLVDTLKKANGNLSYRDLIKRTKALVQSKVKEQSPQLEAVGSSDLDELLFLGGAIGERTPYFTVSYHREYGWIMDGGATIGVSQGMGDETTNLALFPDEVSPAQLQDAKFAIAKAKVVEVLPQLSKVEISGISNLSLNMTFKAIVTSLPLPPKGVIISGEAQGVELARKAIETSNNNQPSLYLRSVETVEKAEFELLASYGKYIITRPADGRALVENLDGYNQSTAFQAIQRLEHITRWMNILELASPATSSIAPNAIELSVYQNGQPLQGTEIRVQYEQQNGQWKRPAIKIRLKNNSNRRLYCALLDLTERYAVQSGFFESGGIWLNAGDEAWALDGREIKPEVKDKYWLQGVTEAKDILKLIVSTAEFDAGLLELKELDSASVRDVKHPRRGNGTLNSLMNRIPSRDILGSDAEEVYDDWVTTQIAFTTVRPQPTTAVPKGEETVPLAAGVQLQGHPELSAKVRLMNANESAGTGTRSLGSNTLPPILRGRAGVNPFKFNTATRGLEPELNLLQLTDIEDPSVVTPNNPLKLVVDNTLEDNEELLAFTYDGEFYLPVGHTQTTPNGKTEIVLDRLIENNPNPDESTRSLQSAINIYFQKIVSQTIGGQYDYPRLALANVSIDGKVAYTQDLQQVQAEVAKAQRVAVYIHGIIGNTENIVPCIHLAKAEIDGQEKSLADLYDVVLTFDYENLNTPIEENAKSLKEKLQAVGLTENHGKQLHLIAHSMGGLVSRWFIEREGGNQIAQHLIMLGTPNGGSPWAKVQDMAMTALTLGLNSLTTITWSVPVMGMLLKVINKRVEVNLNNMQVCLEQMLPHSDFLKNLAASPDPGIPYSIIAGNTSIAPAALTPGTEESNRVQRLMQKLFSKAIALPFFGQTNDIAATVVSITNVNMNRQYQPQIQEVGCDHLVYFSDPIGLNALSQAVLHALNHTESAKKEPEPAKVSPSDVKSLMNNDTNKSSNNSDSNSSIWTTTGIMGLLGALFVSGFFIASQGGNIQVNNQNKPGAHQTK